MLGDPRVQIIRIWNADDLVKLGTVIADKSKRYEFSARGIELGVEKEPH
jgi:hypothetical protein